MPFIEFAYNRAMLLTPAEISTTLLHSKERVFSFFLDSDPYLPSVCDLSISFPFRDMSCVCVCGNTCVCACVSTSLESPPIMSNLRCDWAPISNRFYLV